MPNLFIVAAFDKLVKGTHFTEFVSLRYNGWVRKRLIISALVVLLAGGSAFIWFREATAAVNPQSTESRMFVVSPGEPIRTVAARLEKEGLIRDSLAFFLVVKKQDAETRVQAGDFRLRPSMDAYQILNELQHGSVDVWVTTLEGWRVEEVALKFAQELSIPEQEFLKVAEEGYMFPDTYLFPRDATASTAASIMRNNFDKKVTDEIRNGIASQDLTLEQGIALASIIEREGRTAEDRPVIAGILLNRLKLGQALETDATIQYILGYQSAEKTWWKKAILNVDKEIDSPYNTYKYAGLPPGPIASPGIQSIQAVANPTQTDYYFYIHAPDGSVHYARTFEEHLVNVNTYLR